jgi:hypothetical protein
MGPKRSVGSRKPGSDLQKKKTAAAEPTLDLEAEVVGRSTFVATTVGQQVLSIAVSTHARRYTTTTNQTVTDILTSFMERSQAASRAVSINPSAASSRSPEANAPGVSSQQAELPLPPPPESSSPPPATEEHAQNTIIGYYLSAENNDGNTQETELMKLVRLATEGFSREERAMCMERFERATAEYKKLQQQNKEARSGLSKKAVDALELASFHLEASINRHEGTIIMSLKTLIQKWKKASDEEKNDLREKIWATTNQLWEYLTKQVDNNDKRASSTQQYEVRKAQLKYSRINIVFGFLDIIGKVFDLIFRPLSS